jgi:DNA-directed RNA polymerase beta subunit
MKTNQSTCINLRPIVRKGDKVKRTDPLRGLCHQDGELAIGRNLVVAFMPWKGYNFEDAIVISERGCRRTSSPPSTSTTTSWRCAIPSAVRKNSPPTSERERRGHQGPR